MKKYFFLAFIVLLCFNNQAKSQIVVFPQSHEKYIPIDTIKYRIIYDVKFISNTSTKKTNTDIQVLEIGDNVSKTYSKYLYDNDSVCTMLRKKGIENTPVYQNLVTPEDIYKNYPKGKISVSYRTFLNGPVLKYEEPIPLLKWELSPDRKLILNYQCQKAVSTFRGRIYTAWFTSEIPLSEGPWKFSGLPGLILEISDEKHEFKYLCVGIQKLAKKQPIKYWKWEYQNTTREKILPFLKNMHERPNAFFKSINGNSIVFIKGGNPDLLSYPFNPIELE